MISTMIGTAIPAYALEMIDRRRETEAPGMAQDAQECDEQRATRLRKS